MSTLLALLLSISMLGGCARPQDLRHDSTVPVGLYAGAAGHTESRVITAPQTPEPGPPWPTYGGLTPPRAGLSKTKTNSWVPERLARPHNLNSMPYGRR